MKHRIWPWLALGAIPLLVYPFLMVANVMSLAAEPPHYPVALALRISSQGFLWSSTLYPLVYFGCAIVAFVYSHFDNDRAARRFALLPIVYLIAVIALFLLWLATSE